jgi:DNA replication protein DnaC
MPLTNLQYDKIMRTYNERQLRARHILQDRIRDAYAASPRLKEIDDGIASSSVLEARYLIDSNTEAAASLKDHISSLRMERKALISSLGYDDDYFTAPYVCPDCQDTGYIGDERCHCFKQAAIDLVYTQSNIKDILSTENFSAFSFEYYSDSDINPLTGMSSLDTAKDAVAKCLDFIDHFKVSGGNLYIYGDTGTGKTFLSNCVAKELMDRGCSVIYFTSFQLFDTLGKGVFKKDEDAIAANQNIFDCDLLIIDDLGTELANSFTVSQLFLCINERILRNKSTIISTNLGLRELSDIYSERVLSRISSSYTMIKLSGTDIRIQKKHH